MMIGKFGRIAVSAIALAVSFGAMDAMSAGRGSAYAQASQAAALSAVTQMVLAAEGDGKQVVVGAADLLGDAVGDAQRISFVIAALAQVGDTGVVGAGNGLVGSSFNLSSDFVSAVSMVANTWAFTSPASFAALRAAVEALPPGMMAFQLTMVLKSIEAPTPIFSDDDSVQSLDPGLAALQKNSTSEVGDLEPDPSPSTISTSAGVSF